MSYVKARQRLEQLKQRLHSSGRRNVDSLLEILQSYTQIHDQEDSRIAHSALLSLYHAYQSGRIGGELAKYIYVAESEPTFTLLQDLAARGVLLYVDKLRGVPYCTLCGANLLREQVELSHELEVAVVNAVYGRAMRESERQKRLQEELEKTRKLEQSAKYRPAEHEIEPIYRSQIEAGVRKLILMIIDKIMPEALEHVDDAILDEIVRRVTSLLVSKYRQWSSKNPKASMYILENYSETEFLRRLQVCVEKFPQKSTRCEEIVSAGLKANVVFHEDVKRLILRIFAITALRLGRPSLFAKARRKFTHLMRFLGADGQCRVKSILDLVHDHEIVENVSTVLVNEPDFMKSVLINKPDAFRAVTLNLIRRKDIRRLVVLLKLVRPRSESV